MKTNLYRLPGYDRRTRVWESAAFWTLGITASALMGLAATRGMLFANNLDGITDVLSAGSPAPLLTHAGRLQTLTNVSLTQVPEEPSATARPQPRAPRS